MATKYTLADDQFSTEIVLADLVDTLQDYVASLDSAGDLAGADRVACDEVLTNKGVGLTIRSLDHGREIVRRVNATLGREVTGFVLSEVTTSSTTAGA